VKRLAFGAILATLVATVVRRFPVDELRRRFRPRLAELTKEQLYRRAQDAGIQGRGHMSKDELIAALNAGTNGPRGAVARATRRARGGAS
jgi:hypothetical protein